jgi:outer membrane lipoprotein carrier protein
LTALLLPAALRAEAPQNAADLRPVMRWMDRQKEMRSLSADFTQTRAYRSLRDPLVSKGRIWFSAPGSFRWEIGDPPKTVVVRKMDGIYLIQPARKKAERHSADDLRKKAGAAMFNFPMARDFADFQRQVEINDVAVDGDRCRVEVTPKDAQAKKFLAKIVFEFDTADGRLFSFEMRLREGSSMRNDFSNVRINPRLDKSLFDYDLAGFKITDGRP